MISGPLIVRDNRTNKNTVIGVASTAFASLRNRTVVATYARINQVLPWIEQIVGPTAVGNQNKEIKSRKRKSRKLLTKGHKIKKQSRNNQRKSREINNKVK